MKPSRLALIALLCLWPLNLAMAHGQSTALVRVSEGRLQLDLALVDLEQAIGVDGNGDGNVTWGELRTNADRIARYVADHLTVAGCDLGHPDLLVDEHVDGAYAVLVFTSDCLRADRDMSLDYHLFFEDDAGHRALVSRIVGGRTEASVVLSKASSRATFGRAAPGALHDFASWVAEGIWHIWSGLDHLLFLATLLLAAGGLRQVIKIVSAFTLSHSLTLIAGALGWIHFQSRWVESAIALTVLVGAINLVFPIARRRLWLLALGFGLIHGLGFASVLAGLQLDGAHLIRDLLGFNLGVEIGQLAVVLLFVPLMHLVQHRLWYRQRFTPGAATAIGVIAAVWIFQRLS